MKRKRRVSMEIEEDIQVGFEEAMSWLPSHVVAEACDSNFKVSSSSFSLRFSHFHFNFLL